MTRTEFSALKGVMADIPKREKETIDEYTARIGPYVISKTGRDNPYCSEVIRKALRFDTVEEFNSYKKGRFNKNGNEEPEEEEPARDDYLILCRELNQINDTLNLIQQTMVALVEAWKGAS